MKKTWLLCLFLYSCTENDKLKFETTITKINDSTELHVKKQANVVLDSITYINGKVNGLTKIDKGSHFIYREFTNDVPNGKTFGIYKNGHYRDKGFFLNGNPFSDYFLYRENGKLDRYQCFDFIGHQTFYMTFNENEEIIKTGGFLMYYYRTLIQKEKDSVSIDILIGEPPLCEVNVFVGEPFNDSVKAYQTYQNPREINFKDKLSHILSDSIRVFWTIKYKNYYSSSYLDILLDDGSGG